MNKVILPKQKAITIFLVFALSYYISNLLRAITATISPNLISEFDLSAGDLGLLGGGYFLGFAAVQIPLGYLLDNKGPKKIVSYFLLIAVLGMISFSLSENFITLLISRILIGIGVGACLMGPLTAYRIWYQDETQQRANSWMLMVGAIGMLSSSLPVQFFLPIIGWRMIFITLALLTIFCIILIIFFIPNWNKANIQSNSNDNGSLKEIWNNSFFKSLVPMGFFNYGGLFAIQTLWAGPWMIKVSGYTPEQSANGLFLIYFSLLISFLSWGYLVPKISKNVSDAIRLLKFGAPLNLIVLAFIIYLGPKAGAYHWAFFAVSSVFLSLTQPAVGMAFSLSNAGKALTSFNLLLFIGAFALQWIIGVIIDLTMNLGYSEISGFRFAMIFFLLTSFFSYLFFLIRNYKN
ncbi:MFS transporter [Candidatus Pelagibacter communis]|jgi:MFS family permease|uniref:Major facilitator superfamily transporter n=1 Tax=Pelagibacter ubique (strain HTCC1062) TaxID=335992 RepID=Q4FNZ4_PELUB|nr:MFS transporter [Candidatus Pelagibacter ubique]AAZ21095.1 major facilitator superfamily transporter [Candidatus Pelagibacter ubique HTCC1062]MDA7479842.1 MFS transporter [Candidatus Pelagibacter ubique]MDC0926864.1 MFS transporter [Candidatus Pelagibacter ubique]MDC6464232.1 MFS transporter [Candidatus Pelagibacter ubique]